MPSWTWQDRRWPSNDEAYARLAVPSVSRRGSQHSGQHWLTRAVERIEGQNIARSGSERDLYGAWDLGQSLRLHPSAEGGLIDRGRPMLSMGLERRDHTPVSPLPPA